MLTQEDLKAIETTLDPRFNAVETRIGGVEDRLGTVETRIGGVEGTLERLVIKVVHMDEQQSRFEERLCRLEEIAEKVYAKLDEFIGLIRTQEVELVALRSHVERLEERVERLELNRGFAPI